MLSNEELFSNIVHFRQNERLTGAKHKSKREAGSITRFIWGEVTDNSRDLNKED